MSYSNEGVRRIFDDLTGHELQAASSLLGSIATSRQARAYKIAECLDVLGTASYTDRLVAGVCINTCLDIGLTGAAEDPSQWLAKGEYLRPLRETDGVYMARSYVFKALRKTGEFHSLRDFNNTAESLGFIYGDGLVACEFLFQWIAANRPGSKAEETVAHLGLRSGRMSHNIYGKGDFSTGNLLFHQDILNEYVDLMCRDSSTCRTKIDPVIVLLATDDWDRAVSMLSLYHKRKLQ